MDPSTARAISTWGILFGVRGMEGGAFPTLAERSTKENGGTIRNTDRLVDLICNTHLVI